MSFMPIQPCCLKRQVLPGEPAGVFEPPSSQRSVGRYVARPQDAVPAKPNTAILLFYDAMGLGEPNPKILADTLAAKLRLPVVVPDYMPSPPKAATFEDVLDSTPGEHAGRPWYKTVWVFVKFICAMLPYLPSILDRRVIPLCNKAVAELKQEGYTNLGAIGYCRGGSVVLELLSHGDASPIACGVLCHPSPDAQRPETITRPSEWHLASDDMAFKDAHIAKLRQVMDAKKGVEFACTVHPDTVHGFAARPNLASESAVKAFEAAHDSAVRFFSQHLL